MANSREQEQKESRGGNRNGALQAKGHLRCHVHLKKEWILQWGKTVSGRSILPLARENAEKERREIGAGTNRA